MGKRYIIEAAVDANGDSPALIALQKLAAGDMNPDPDHPDGEPWPDETQSTDRSNLMAMMKRFADDGVPPFGRAINNLENGIWEFKVGSKRFTFFDTDGRGSFEPKLRIKDPKESRYPDDQFWWLPDFARVIRLGYVFVKPGATAGAENIQAAIQIRTEDLLYDEVEELDS